MQTTGPKVTIFSKVNSFRTIGVDMIRHTSLSSSEIQILYQCVKDSVLDPDPGKPPDPQTDPECEGKRTFFLN